MTQLALVEVVEGSDSAVDLSDELLALYNRLFGDPDHDKPKVQVPPTIVVPPKSSIGSIRGSIFRSKSSRRSHAIESPPRSSSVVSASTVGTQTTAAPTIQVTDESGANRGDIRGRSGSHKHKEQNATTPKRSRSKLQKRSSASLRRKSQADTEKVPEMSTPVRATNGTSHQPGSARGKSPGRHSRSSSLQKSIENHDRPLRPVAHNMSPKAEPPPTGHATQLPRQDIRLPTAFPSLDYIPQDPRFSTLQERRQKVTLLVAIWIFISGLYTRAEMYDDASGAVGEAIKLVEIFELEVAQESSSSRAFATRGWGGGKSVEELWADAYAAVSGLPTSSVYTYLTESSWVMCCLRNR